MKFLIFTAVWCPGCIVMEKRWNELEESFKDIEFIKYDSEDNDIEFDEWEIGDKIPVSILLNENGNEIERFIGEKSTDILKKVIEKHREE